MRRALILAALVAVSGCSVLEEKKAYGGVAADGLSTVAALAAPGIVEANPIGYVTIPLRIAAIEYANTLPEDERLPIIHAVSAASWAAATSNVLVLAGAMNPVALTIAAAVWWWQWSAGSDEREYADFCADWMKTLGNTCKPYRS